MGDVLGIVIVLLIFANAFCTGWLMARVRKRDRLLESMQVEVERAKFERDIAWKHMSESSAVGAGVQSDAEIG